MFKIIHYFIGINISLSYIRIVMGEKKYVKMCHFGDFLDFENGCCYLNTIARKIRKTHGFHAFLLKSRHYLIGLNTSLSYIRMVMGETLC